MPFTSIPSPPSVFPTYLVPSLPFRRRKSSTDTTTSTATTSSSFSASSPPAPTHLVGSTSHLRCSRCLTDLALASQIISKGFTGRHGRAYLVSASSTASTSHTAAAPHRGPPNLPNTHVHKAVPRQLVTGAHTVSDISCAQCGAVLGWKYVSAEEESQRYKVGKFILETRRICRSTCWEGEDEGEGGVGGSGSPVEATGAKAEDEIEFDSQDEDECEDLFAGVWSPQSAAKRRKEKQFSMLED
ncbi:hypothetical protein LTR39_002112 [Cryomyces antarcticus]|nr:hypothetical protein LTR39_002112 [Cryomyces antarcticus]